ncbi:MAG: PEP-CTERM sorting domain-containing protein [Fimbriimonadaceae bacterium]|nr:PEP-CTERM sorting domain-containing protein [Fimbriimonadaceae bacterium]
MRNLLLLAAAVVVGSANAATLWDNGYASPDGYFSDALATNGSQFWAQTMGDNFTLSSASTITQICFTGSSENFVFPGLDNFSSFEINILDSSFTPVFNTTVATAGLSPTSTGNFNGALGEEFLMTANVNVNLAAGNYFLNVGSNNIAPGDDGWIWATGSRDASLIFNLFDGNGWQTAADDVSFQIKGDAVPEPATMIALGAGLLALARRRKA